MLKNCWKLLQSATVTPEIVAALKVLGFDALRPSSSSSSSLSSSLSIRKSHSSLPPLPKQEEVRLRYRQLAQQFHPDLSSGDSQRMKHINAAYELLQSSGILMTSRRDVEGGATSESSVRHTASTDGSVEGKDGAASGRGRTTARAKQRKAVFSRSSVPLDFASGGDQSWALKSALEWRSMVGNVDQLRPEELENPANHPLSHSKFFSMEEDATIYHMLRGGATIPQTARTLGKPATFIEKRLHNVQFKLRVQYLMRSAKKRFQQEESKKKKKNYYHHHQGKFTQDQGGKREDSPFSTAWKRSPHSRGTGVRGPNMTLSALRPHAGGSCVGDGEEEYLGRASDASSFSLFREAGDVPPRKDAWEPSVSRWDERSYYADLSLEEKSKYDRIPQPRESY